jgi:aminoglycoside phosphotransferase family enzyme|tara:strand:+ start:638 stop:883 length:246 start_codon:yes stop_codon:yes gene_type:complete
MRTREGLVEKVYDCIRNNTPLSSIHIPHSDVFFVREALEARFDCELSLLQVEEYMKEAGWSDTNQSTEVNKTDIWCDSGDS